MEDIMTNHITTGESIFDDLGFDESEAENLKIRAGLMRSIEKYITEKKLTQSQAAKLMRVTQPRISDLTRGKIDRFTIDMLVNMLACTHASISLVVNDQIAA
jgi:predicted XRE-type DNA-binding protein